MKKIEATIKPFKLDAVKEALRKEKVCRISVSEVKGAGIQQGAIKQYRGVRYIEDPLELRVELLAEDDEADRLAQSIMTALGTGDLCDGEVAILPVEKSFRVRIGKCS